MKLLEQYTRGVISTEIVCNYKELLFTKQNSITLFSNFSLIQMFFSIYVKKNLYNSLSSSNLLNNFQCILLYVLTMQKVYYYFAGVFV